MQLEQSNLSPPLFVSSFTHLPHYLFYIPFIMSSADSKEYNEKIEISELESQGGGFTVLEKPTVVFDEAAEKALYRKMDLRVMPILALLYLLS